MMGKFAFDLKLLTDFIKHVRVMPLTILCFWYRSKSVDPKLSGFMSFVDSISL